MTRYQPRSLAPLPMTHTLRPVVDEMRSAQHPPGAHVTFPEVAWPEPAELPIGMVEPPEPIAFTITRNGRRVASGVARPKDHSREAAKAAVDEAEAAALAAKPPRAPWVDRLVPSTGAAFWMGIAGWFIYLHARAEGWL